MTTGEATAVRVQELLARPYRMEMGSATALESKRRLASAWRCFAQRVSAV